VSETDVVQVSDAQVDQPASSVTYRNRILVADDEESMRRVMREVMLREGYEVETATNGLEAVQKVRESDFDLVILDVKMPQMDGLTALREIKRVRPDLIVVIITAHGSSQTAIDAVREGAYDYFSKPFEVSEMRIVVRRALEKQTLLRQISALERRLTDRFSFDRIIGRSPAMAQVYELIEKVITNDVTVLVTGESGTGKELVAQAVHYHSRRKSKPFVSVNCAAIPEALLESELFGHEKGSFTGAIGTKLGKFEAAEGGSIFLDEIGDMPLSLQSKLLRVLQEREIVRVGGNRSIKVDIRVIAATNQNLLEAVKKKAFREDLYFRLNVLPVLLPPLRQRHEDIPLLIMHFIGLYNTRMNKNVQSVSPEAMEIMMNYPWPGNVRELENIIQRAMVLAATPILTVQDLPAQVVNATPEFRRPTVEGSFFEKEFIEDFSLPIQQKIEKINEELELRIIKAALAKAEGHRQDTADLLGISRKSLHNKMVKYKLFDGRGETEGVE
jgi:two-component system, NtrC family, nitrogen regulation response regulator GlnG